MSRDRILLTGASGFLGHALVAEIESRGLECIRAGRDAAADLPLDLEDPKSVVALGQEGGARVVLHAAAWTSIGKCEADPSRAVRVNSESTTALADAAGPSLVFVSTDLVFDGRSAPYGPADPVAPLSVYGTTKADAEGSVLSRGGRVMRIPLLFGRSFNGRRGATDMLRSSTRRLVLYDNEFRSPLHVSDAARALVELALEKTEPVSQIAGLERVSRVELAERFVAAGGVVPGGFEGRPSADPLRPRDVSLESDWLPERSLDEALRES